MASSAGDHEVVFDELCGFLTADTMPNVRNVALSHLEGVSVGAVGVALLLKADARIADLLLTLLRIPQMHTSVKVSVLRILINGCATSNKLAAILFAKSGFEEWIIDSATDTKAPSSVTEGSAKLLSNVTLSLSNEFTDQLCRRILAPECTFIDRTTSSLCTIDSDSGSDSASAADYCGYTLINLSRVVALRRRLVHGDDNLTASNVNPPSSTAPLFQLLPLLNQQRNAKRRLIVASLLRNCSFDHDVRLCCDDVLVALLTPLIGGEELGDDENDSLPVDLQYMDSGKERDPDPVIRRRLLDALYQMCSTASSREFLRTRGVYYVMREYHKWETDTEAHQLIENVVGLLLLEEAEIGADDISRIPTNDMASAATPRIVQLE